MRAWHQASLTYQACVLQVGPCRQAGTAVMLITLTALLLAFWVVPAAGAHEPAACQLVARELRRRHRCLSKACPALQDARPLRCTDELLPQRLKPPPQT